MNNEKLNVLLFAFRYAVHRIPVGAMLSGKQADYPAMYEEAKAYARKHIAHVYAHDIDGVKVDESLKDIALYSLIELYMVKAWEQEMAEDEETYSLGPCLDSALIAAANKSIKAFRNLQNELNSVNSVQKSNEDAEK